MSERMYVSVIEAEEITGISQWTWRTWAYSGKCASVKTGKQKQARLLIPVGEIERLMSNGLRPAVNVAATLQTPHHRQASSKETSDDRR